MGQHRFPEWNLISIQRVSIITFVSRLIITLKQIPGYNRAAEVIQLQRDEGTAHHRRGMLNEKDIVTQVTCKICNGEDVHTAVCFLHIVKKILWFYY